jgi:hypothetical protein
MRTRPFIYQLIKTIFKNNGILLAENYSVGAYQRADGRLSYSVLTQNGDIHFESLVPIPAIACFVDLVGEGDTSRAIDLYIAKN